MKAGKSLQRPRRTIKTVVVAARVDEAFRARLWDACARSGLTESEAVRDAVEAWVAARTGTVVPARTAPIADDRLRIPEPALLELNSPKRGKIGD